MKPRIALIHDHLIQEGGAERVLRSLAELYSEAPIYTLVYDRKRMNEHFPPSRVHTSFLQHLPMIHRTYQWFLPLMPMATETYDLTDFDIVISSCSAFSKGVITKPDTIHISYCHTPTRYLWSDTHSYLQEIKKPRIIKSIIPPLLTQIRLWDRLSADRVDIFIANSQTVSQRINKYYGKKSIVIHPPVSLNRFSIGDNEQRYYLAGGRLVSYKRLDLVIDAFNRLGLPLHIFGKGPQEYALKKKAKKNIIFMGAIDDKALCSAYQKCIAYIHPQEEDFGITQVEAMACGKPVIAYARGGALETIIPGVTGHFFDEHDYASLIDSILHFKANQFDPQRIRNHALKFSEEEFKKNISILVDRVIQRRIGKTPSISGF